MLTLADAATRARAVADHLELTIAEMQPGDRLGTKKDLCKNLGVSPATFNEALRLLQERGIVTLRPGPQGGIFAAQPDPYVRLGQSLLAVRGQPDTIRQASDVRDQLEGLVVLEAARHRTEEDLDCLREQLRRIEAAIDSDLDFLRAIWKLHQTIALCCANLVLRNIYLGLLEIIGQSAQSVAPGTKPLPYKRRRIAVHTKLVDAIESQDESLCKKAVREHAKH